MYHSFLIHSSADGHLGCFHVLAIINSAAMNIEVHVSLSDLFSSVCMPRGGIKNPGVVLKSSCGMGWEMGWEMGQMFKREGTYLYLWLIHVDVWQKPTQYWKAIILQLKRNIKKTILVFFLKDEKDKTSTTQNWIYKERSESL